MLERAKKKKSIYRSHTISFGEMIFTLIDALQEILSDRGTFTGIAGASDVLSLLSRQQNSLHSNEIKHQWLGVQQRSIRKQLPSGARDRGMQYTPCHKCEEGIPEILLEDEESAITWQLLGSKIRNLTSSNSWYSRSRGIIVDHRQLIEDWYEISMQPLQRR